MTVYPLTLEKLIASLKKIPGVGPRSAERMAFFFLNSAQGYVEELSENLKSVKKNLRKCSRCFAFTDQEGLCRICSNEDRDQGLICVVETFKDLLALEEMGGYGGLYHVLEGHLSPLDGVHPQDLRIEELVKRAEKEGVREIILATNLNVEGDATAFYISRILKKQGVRITRLAKGLPVGSDLEYADSLSLSNSFKNREEI
jgi:recombination protein RecR